jgi:hypothetical protein
VQTISRNDLQELLGDTAEGPHVSIYMPAVVAGQQTLQNPIRFKNLTREAEGYLHQRGMNEHEAARLLKPALRMIEDEEFWQHQDAGLAVLVAKDRCHQFRLPIEFQELVAVQDRFYIKPLLPALAEGERFYILALSKNRVRLFDSNRHGAREIELENVPRSLAEALGHELTSPSSAFHGGVAPRDAAQRLPDHQGQVASAYEDDSKMEVQQFFKRLNPGLKRYLHDGRPLVLAGVEYLLAAYQQETDYKPVVGKVTGNFDTEKPHSVHEQAWPIVEPYFAQARDAALERYSELAGTGRSANGLDEIVIAATEGRIDTLFVSRDARCWGRFHAAERRIEAHDEPRTGDKELLDMAAVNTILQGGRVFVLAPEQVPDGEPQAAILRY